MTQDISTPESQSQQEPCVPGKAWLSSPESVGKNGLTWQSYRRLAMTERDNLASNVRRLCAERFPDIKQRGYAKQLGVSEGQMSKVLNAKTNPSWTLLEHVAAKLGVTIVDLLSSPHQAHWDLIRPTPRDKRSRSTRRAPHAGHAPSGRSLQPEDSLVEIYQSIVQAIHGLAKDVAEVLEGADSGNEAEAAQVLERILGVRRGTSDRQPVSKSRAKVKP